MIKTLGGLVLLAGLSFAGVSAAVAADKDTPSTTTRKDGDDQHHKRHHCKHRKHHHHRHHKHQESDQKPGSNS